MIATILIITVTAVLGTWAVRRLLRSDQSHHQFPTAYQLLKSSPSIDRREMWALRMIAGVERGISTTIINLSHLMDPITVILLFNVAVWCYWSFK
jgi:hypothetical protein